LLYQLSYAPSAARKRWSRNIRSIYTLRQPHHRGRYDDDIRLERGEEGYQVGAYMFNIVAADLIFAAIFLGILISQWPSPPWDLLLYGGALIMVVIPVLFYPVSKTLFLTFDLIFRHPAPEDFQ
jgi:hypothetical protein